MNFRNIKVLVVEVASTLIFLAFVYRIATHEIAHLLTH